MHYFQKGKRSCFNMSVRRKYIHAIVCMCLYAVKIFTKLMGFLIKAAQLYSVQERLFFMFFVYLIVVVSSAVVWLNDDSGFSCLYLELKALRKNSDFQQKY